ncbi:MucR family transcriptional regulator [Agrobacterium rubi]|nr:MucR family transcriptional regulator [Agrobacterium rubi]NTF24281.1 MucR family transcriptional regulator [Agrobacterium rubi]
MPTAVTEADRIRISDDMVGATSGLVAAMLNSKMVSRDELPGIVRDIHRTLIEISVQSVAVVERLDTFMEIPSGTAAERRSASSASISRAVSKLLDMSTTEVEPAVPHQVRVPPTSAPRPAATPAAAAPQIEARIPAKAAPPAAPVAKTVKPPVARAAPAPAAEPAVKAKSPAPSKPGTSLASPELKTTKPWSGEERRARPIKAKTVIEPVLPAKLTSIEQALTLEYIVCLEDGKRVKDLKAHLAARKITPEEYRTKWKLPPEYPMIAPSLIRSQENKRVPVYEIDLVTGKARKVR